MAFLPVCIVFKCIWFALFVFYSHFICALGLFINFYGTANITVVWESIVDLLKQKERMINIQNRMECADYSRVD